MKTLRIVPSFSYPIWLHFDNLDLILGEVPGFLMLFLVGNWVAEKNLLVD
jgi:hypothetical protein